MNRMLAGALSGLAATVPMTVAMEIMHRRLPHRERDPLPPRKIVDRLAHKADVDDHLSEDEQQAAALVAHFGFGGAMGMLYGATFERPSEHPVLRGAAFGLGVWAGNYLGVLPALDILRPATQHRPRRNLLMIAAHLVWGASAGLAYNVLRAPEADSPTTAESFPHRQGQGARQPAPCRADDEISIVDLIGVVADSCPNPQRTRGDRD